MNGLLQRERDGRSEIASGFSAEHEEVIRQVDRAVRAVLAEAQGKASRAAGGNVFAERLFSLRHAEGLPASVREVRLAPGAVVTPLARDFLRRQGVTIRLVSHADVATAARRGEWGFAIEGDSGVLLALRRSLLEEALPWTEIEPAAALAGWVAGSDDRGGLLLTGEASVAVWRAHQNPGIRAASASEPEAVARAVGALGVNLLVVEPAGKPIALLRQLALTFRKPGAPRIPEALTREALR